MFLSGPCHDQQLFARMGLTSRLKRMRSASASAGKGDPADIPAAIMNTHPVWRCLINPFSMEKKMSLSAFRVNLCRMTI